MAGYLLTFSSPEALFECMQKGVYSPLMSLRWGPYAVATLADLATMKAGDNVYFFSKRMVYGIGEVVEVKPGITIAENYPGITTMGSVEQGGCFPTILDHLPTSHSQNPSDKIQRWFFTFRPSPIFYAQGIDMDDLLHSDPSAFRSLRVFWKRTFIKLDDAENLAFKAAILRKNLQSTNHADGHPSDFEQSINRMKKCGISITSPDFKNLLASKRKKKGTLKTEMLLELALLAQLSSKDSQTEKVFGHWDYLSHQVTASPMKAVDYMDRIDVFGYSWIEGYEGQIVNKYLVCELKKDVLKPEDLSQAMKYVDWVCDEYANGDYSQICAFLVGRSLDETTFEKMSGLVLRNYLTGRRPPKNNVWCNLTVATYHVTEEGHVEFTPKVQFCSTSEDVSSSTQ